MTPEEIQGQLFAFRSTAHKLHLDTRSYAEHKALGGLYESMGDFADEISEKVMGYMGGKRIGKSPQPELPVYSKEAVTGLCDDIVDFASKLETWATSKKYADIQNIAQSLSGLGAKTKYLLTLS